MAARKQKKEECMRSPLSCLLAFLFLPLAANAATYPVTSTADTMATGTLRWAIYSATTNEGRDIITFALSSTTISPTGALPYLGDLSQAGTVIDGTTQPGYSGTPLVKLVGTNAGAAVGLYLATSSNIVKGLIITRFRGAGISVGDGEKNVLVGNHVVSNAENGIHIWGGHQAQVGGTSADLRNVISSNWNYGIRIDGSTWGNVLEGNYIGVDPSGSKALSNRFVGVLVMAPSNRIGGAAVGARNVISGNGSAGIMLSGADAYGNVVEGNYCGVNAAGNAAIPNVSGIQLAAASNNTIEGNVLSGNVNYGLHLQVACHGNTVAGNFIGTDAAGTAAVSNTYEGIVINADCGDNQIGGDDEAGRNVIAGNGYHGIYVSANTGLVIRGNYIGISTNGSRLANGMDGIILLNCARVTIGGTNDAARNMISGNGGAGIWMSGGVSNTVRYNTIGLNRAGTAVSNNTHGVYADSGRGHEISDNLISGNGQYGIYLQGATNCAVKRNRVGTDAAGASATPNRYAGLVLSDGSANNQIGGRWSDEGNVFSGNAIYGIMFPARCGTNNVIQGNRIGTDESGTTAVPNGSDGIDIEGATYTVVGSTNGSGRNVISGNVRTGIQMYSTNTHHNLVIGNYIGLDVTGTNELPNTSSGIYFYESSSNQVGGVMSGAVNRIAYNGGDGIQLGSGDGNLLVNNSIYRNGVLGIDLGYGTPTANDVGDSDGGPNRQQNFPVLISVSNEGPQIRVVWTLDSVPSQPFIIEFYGSTGPGRLTRGDGEYSLGSVGPLVMPPVGLLGGTNVFPTPDPPPNFISALAHHADLQDTSEFSQRVMLDSDNDGMADGYEAIYFGGYTGGAPDGQADGDGVLNIEEFWWDTNPIDYGSFPCVKSIGSSGNFVQLTAKCSRDRSYQLFVCTNLNAVPQLWVGRPELLTYEGEDGRYSIPITNRANFRIRASVP